MGTTKVFKSGNSAAVRLPAAFGAVPGTVVEVREEAGRWVLEPVGPQKRKFNIAKVAGSATQLEFIRDEDRVFEERPLLWKQLKESGGQ